MVKVSAMLLILAAIAGTATAQMCGDCDGDGRVMVAELVRAVNNALASDECGEGCMTSGACPQTCSKFPLAFINGRPIECNASICMDSDAQIERCVTRMIEAHRVFCYSPWGAR